MLLRSNKQWEKWVRKASEGEKSKLKNLISKGSKAREKPHKMGVFHGKKKVSKNETFCGIYKANLLTKGLSDFLVTRKKNPLALGSACFTTFVEPFGCDTST